MKTIIKSQVALLVSMFTAIALTLTACGGGSSSSSAGGSSLNAATVSGTVRNGGLARLEIDGNRGLLLAVSDLLVPVARADGVANVPVVVDCSASGGETGNTTTDINGNFTLTLNNVGTTGDCVITVNNEASQNIALRAGARTEVEVSMSGGSVRFVSVDNDSSDDSSPGAVVAGEVEDDDSVASADEISEDGVSDAESDEGSVDDESEDDSPSEDDESEDDSSKSKNNA